MARVHGRIEGLYILHPNNVGRCGHQANASYAVRSQIRGLKIGEKLLEDSLARAGELGYRLLIFNAVVKGNGRAVRLYDRLGFVKIGEVPGGFLMKDGNYQDTMMFYHTV
ncbi:MAG: GNAT family N-acetyltransferase [Lachnospiraceae bacterium]|nr:GNAT family N-acetyltransferase [Lachnospiraceae bacterium]